ncbi:olfactory receptor 5AR1-like [Pelobates fuscus]|uniref:olfactory receptor 5AR1-like n=1 Tax=Pelobates fuscus TaxID=191477 RepID=UPI002FE43ECD
MDKINCTMITEFVFFGLSENSKYQIHLFLLFLCIYVISFSGNASIILLYNLSSNLHNPMYFNLANFSFTEICYISAIVPKMLANFLSERKAISFYGCAIQMYCGFLFGSVECYMLAAMAYDRYNAICRPLSYTTIMSRKVCIQLITGSWLISAVNSLIHNILTFTLPFCGNNTINHFACDVPPVLKLASTDTWINEIVLFAVGGCVIIVSFVLTMVSYVNIISAIFTIHSSSGRKKALSTCTSHFIVVAIFYGSTTFMYFRPKSEYSLDQDRLVSVMYTNIAPLLNPFIYSIRNNDVKLAFVHIINQIKTESKKLF